MFTRREMSLPARESMAALQMALRTITHTAGARFHEERVRRRWTLRELGRRAGLSAAAVHAAESGRTSSLATYVRLGHALGMRIELSFVDPRRRSEQRPVESDFLHAAMGELEAARVGSFHFGLGIDEPYQHYQFAGRADVVVWDLAARALLHIENRTRFPNMQGAAGSWNAKRSYLPAVMADRLGLSGRWASVTNVMVGLWSSEVLHVLRLRTQTFRALCPDSPLAFERWWAGSPPPSGSTSTFVVLDPGAHGRQRLFCGLDDALRARPRYSGYAEAARLLDVSKRAPRADFYGR